MVVWIYIQLSISNGLFSIKKAKLIFFVNFVVLALNLILGILGFGYYQYAGGIGTVGFFFAGNEVSGSMLCIFFPVLFYVFKRYSFLVYTLTAILIFSLAVFKVTKVAIGGTLLIIFIIPTVHFVVNYSAFSLKRIRFFFYGLYDFYSWSYCWL
jgi:hypothetical protein